MQMIRAVGAPVSPQNVYGATTPSRGASAGTSGASFKDLLQDAVQRLKSNPAAANGTTKPATPPAVTGISATLAAAQRARETLDSVAAVQNRLVNAYNEIKDLRI